MNIFNAKPVNLTDNFIIKVLVLCAMYVAQGITHGFITTTLVFHLTEHGLESDAIGGMLAIASYPWAVKWIWGPIIDRFTFPAMGRRRPWIICAQLMMSATMLLLLLVGDLSSNIRIVAWIIFLHNVFKSIQDVSVDALAVDVIEESRRGKINGLMYGCSYVGAMFGTAFTFIMTRAGMSVALLTMVGILVLIMLLPILVRERAGEKLLPWTAGASQLTGTNAVVTSSRELFSSLLKAFSLRSSICTGLLAVLIYIPINVMGPLSAILMMKKLGFNEEFLAQLGIIGTVSAMAGAMGGGFIADKIGHKKSIIIALTALSVFWAANGFLTSFWFSKTYMLLLMPIPGLLVGFMATSYFSLAMDISWKKVAGSQFSTYMALLNLSMVIAFKLAAPLEAFCTRLVDGSVGDFLRGLGCFQYDEVTPYAIIYIFMALFHVVVLVPLLFIDPHQTRNTFGAEES